MVGTAPPQSTQAMAVAGIDGHGHYGCQGIEMPNSRMPEMLAENAPEEVCGE
jgi:hypothetical protein